MTLWIFIFWTAIAVICAALVYLGSRLSLLFPTEGSVLKQVVVSGGLIAVCAALLSWSFDFLNAMICLFYLALIWAVTDVAFWLLQKVFHLSIAYPYLAAVAVFVTILALSAGWYLNHNAWPTYYRVTTEKEVPPVKIVMFADSHLGTTFHTDGFIKRLEMIQAYKPDFVFVVGDYVDDGTRREEMIKSTQALGKLKTKYGVYFVMGNHDKGYYGSARRGFSKQDLIQELQKAGIIVLQDEVSSVDDAFYIIGRQDHSVEQERAGTRLTMEELTAPLDKNKYMIVLDHQPADYKNQTQVDLVLSGHTHGGQLFPFNWVGKWIGANDAIYGHTHKGQADFIVTSGLSDWAIQFKTGTKSEFVVIDVLPIHNK